MYFIRSFILSFLLLYLNLCAVIPQVHSGLDDNRIDSLLQVICDGIVSDSLLMEVHFDISRQYRMHKPSKALHYAQNALVLAKKLEYELITAYALTETAYLKWRLSQFDEALGKLADATDIFLRHNDISGYARVLNTRGAIYSEKGHAVKALEDFFSALKKLEDIDSIARTGAILNNIAMIYQWQDDYKMAEKYHLRSLAVREKYDDETGIAFSLNNLGVISQTKGDFAEALVFFQQSLAIRQALNDNRGIASVKRNMGSMYFEQQNYEKALQYYGIARDRYEDAEDLSGIIQTDHFLGRVYLEKGELELAQHYLEPNLSVF